MKISNTNGNYAHKAFIETEISSSRTAKGTWLVCQGYYFENEPQKIDGQDDRAEDVTARKALVADSLEKYFIGKPASDIFTCDKHLLSGVTLRISFRRSSNDFAVISEADKHYKGKIIEANLYVRKMTIADHVLSAIEKPCLRHLQFIYTTRFYLERFLLLVVITAGDKKMFFQRNPYEEWRLQCHQIRLTLDQIELHLFTIKNSVSRKL